MSRSDSLRASIGPLVSGHADAQALLVEACRISDRLDRLDEILTGDAAVWCRLVHDLRTEDYEIKVDAALSEARQQASTLRALLDSIRKMTPKDQAQPAEVSVADQLAAKRKARGAGPDGVASASRRGQPRRGGGSNRTG